MLLLWPKNLPWPWSINFQVDSTDLGEREAPDLLAGMELERFIDSCDRWNRHRNEPGCDVGEHKQYWPFGEFAGGASPPPLFGVDTVRLLPLEAIDFLFLFFFGYMQERVMVLVPKLKTKMGIRQRAFIYWEFIRRIVPEDGNCKGRRC